MKRFTSLLAVAVVLGGVAVVQAGRIPGPARDVETIKAYSRVTYSSVVFRAGELAVVQIQGDGSTDLDVFVYDEDGNLVAQGIGPTDYERVTWTPRWTGPFRIVVENLGSSRNTYFLRTN
jgi:hypothetical protein